MYCLSGLSVFIVAGRFSMAHRNYILRSVIGTNHLDMSAIQEILLDNLARPRILCEWCTFTVQFTIVRRNDKTIPAVLTKL